MSVLEESRWFWPIVLFPYIADDSHTITFTGRAIVRDVKSSFSRVILAMTEDEIEVRGRLSRKQLLVVPLGQIESVDRLEGNPEVLDVRFRSARWGWLARFVTSGQPPGARNRILLNVSDTGTWEQELARRIS